MSCVMTTYGLTPSLDRNKQLKWAISREIFSNLIMLYKVPQFGLFASQTNATLILFISSTVKIQVGGLDCNNNGMNLFLSPPPNTSVPEILPSHLMPQKQSPFYSTSLESRALMLLVLQVVYVLTWVIASDHTAMKTSSCKNLCRYTCGTSSTYFPDNVFTTSSTDCPSAHPSVFNKIIPFLLGSLPELLGK